MACELSHPNQSGSSKGTKGDSMRKLESDMSPALRRALQPELDAIRRSEEGA